VEPITIKNVHSKLDLDGNGSAPMLHAKLLEENMQVGETRTEKSKPYLVHPGYFFLILHPTQCFFVIVFHAVFYMVLDFITHFRSNVFSYFI